MVLGGIVSPRESEQTTHFGFLAPQSDPGFIDGFHSSGSLSKLPVHANYFLIHASDIEYTLHNYPESHPSIWEVGGNDEPSVNHRSGTSSGLWYPTKHLDHSFEERGVPFEFPRGDNDTQLPTMSAVNSNEEALSGPVKRKRYKISSDSKLKYLDFVKLEHCGFRVRIHGVERDVEDVFNVVNGDTR